MEVQVVLVNFILIPLIAIFIALGVFLLTEKEIKEIVLKDEIKNINRKQFFYVSFVLSLLINLFYECFFNVYIQLTIASFLSIIGLFVFKKIQLYYWKRTKESRYSSKRGLATSEETSA